MYSRYLASPTVVPRRWPYIAHVYECLPYFHDLFTRGSPNTVERPGKFPAIRILSADILSLPYRYDVVSDTVKYWIHKRCKHFGPNSAQVELMSQIVSSAMWPGCRVGTSSKRATRIHQHDHAYHLSAKLGGHQQVRYHRYVRFAIGTHHRDNFLGWLIFIKLQVLSVLNLLCLFFMMPSRLGSGVLLERS